MLRGLLLLLVSSSLAACTSCGDDFTEDSDVDAAIGGEDPDAAASIGPDANPLRPTRLEETGLYADISTKTISALVTEYATAFDLWSDGATKRRWFQLPPGGVIDTSDMDFWRFPEGTRLWKEFAIGSTLVETRLYWKQGPGASDWRAFTFAWNAAQDEAIAITDGAIDALGTGHEIPSVFLCAACHGTQPDIVLGVSAIQADGAFTQFDIDDFVAAGLLSDPPAGSAPYFPLPGDGVEQAALGYLHANCGGCHYSGSTVQDIVPLELRLDVGNMATVEDTAAFRTAVGQPNVLGVPGATALIEPGDPAASAVSIRMNSTGNIRMPEVGTSIVDVMGTAMVDGWIGALPPTP